MSQSRLRYVVMAVALALVGLGPAGQTWSEDTAIPGLVDLSRLKVEIASAVFLTSLDSDGAEFNETRPDQYRGLVVTVRLTKPAGSELTLHPADFSLHYRRAGGEYDVAPCHGISSFSTAAEVDRAMSFFSGGWGSVSTGASTLGADTVYADLFFQNMESDTRELHVLVAQPVGARFATPGWSPETAPAGAEGGLDGVWLDDSTGTRMTIARDGTGYAVTSAVDDDGEVFPVSNVRWDGSVLRWTYDVPSTDYRINWATVDLRGDRLETRWDGTAGSGTEVLHRVGDATPLVEAVPGTSGAPLDGLGIRVVHVDRRRADAEEAARRLRALGATVELFETSDSGNEAHTGTLYVRSGYRQLADAVIDAAKDLEPLEAAEGTTFSPGQQFNVWITR